MQVVRYCTLALVCFFPPGYLMRTAHADGYAYGAGISSEYSNNIRRTQTNRLGEWIDSIYAGGAYQDQGPVLDTYLLAQAEYRDYRNDTYEDGPNYYADASLLWRIAPKRMHWSFVDRYSQVTLDTTRPDTPDNRANVNVLRTGPDFFIRLGQVNTLSLGARYGRDTYSAGNPDNQRYSGFARWLYSTSATTTYSLNYEAERIQYSDTVLYERLFRQDVYIRRDWHEGRDQLLLDLGATHFDRDDLGELTGTLARLTWTQQITSISTLGLVAAGEYLDTGTALLVAGTGGSGQPLDNVGVTNDIFYMKRIEGHYHRNDNTYGFEARGFFRSVDYVTSLLDRQEYGGRLEGSYTRDGSFITAVYGSHLTTRYLDTSRDDWEQEAGLRLLYRITRTLRAVLDGRQIWHSSSDDAVVFDESRIMLSLVYSSGPLYVPRADITGSRTVQPFRSMETYPTPSTEVPASLQNR